MDGTLDTYLSSDLAPFCELLRRLCTPDAVQRTQAESIFNSLKDHRPDGLVTKLLEVLRQGTSSAELRPFSATLLRQVRTLLDHGLNPPGTGEGPSTSLAEYFKTRTRAREDRTPHSSDERNGQYPRREGKSNEMLNGGVFAYSRLQI